MAGPSHVLGPIGSDRFWAASMTPRTDEPREDLLISAVAQRLSRAERVSVGWDGCFQVRVARSGFSVPRTDETGHHHSTCGSSGKEGGGPSGMQVEDGGMSLTL
jgi:hypothetical protein